jgi:uncharacterized RDD family membrane protein YckC
MPAKIAESQASARVDAAHVAGLPRRAVAGGIDAGVVAAGITLFAFSFKTFPFTPDLFETLPPWNGFDIAVDLVNEQLLDIAALLILFLAGVFLLGFLSEAFWGSSAGRLLTGTRLVDTHGRTPSIPRLFLRNLGRVAEIPLLGIGLLMAYLLPSRRTLHDLLSGTLVVRVVRK